MIVVNNRAFHQALGMLGRVVERRNTIAILDSVKATVNGKLELSGTDLDMSLHVGLPVAAPDGGKAKPGTFLLENFRQVQRAVAVAGGEAVSLVQTDKGVRLTGGDLVMESGNGISVEDWPSDQSAVQQPWMTATLSPDHLAQIERVTAAISKEETRYYLNGVYLHHIKDWTWRAVATDGHRMMFVDLQLPDASGEAAGVIIPRKSLRVALDLLGKCDEGVAFQIGGAAAPNQETSTAPDRLGSPRLSLTGKAGAYGVRLTTKVIDGTYPDYARVVPTTTDWQALVTVARLRKAVLSVSALFAKAPVVKLTFEPDAIVVSAVDVPGMAASFRCEAQHGAGKGFVIGFNGQYLMDLLNAIRGPEVVISGTDAAAPTVFRDPADERFTAIQMPMRV